MARQTRLSPTSPKGDRHREVWLRVQARLAARVDLAPGRTSKLAAMLLQIERLVRRGAGSMGSSLHLSWPQSGYNEIPEANVQLHVGHALLAGGWATFVEAHRAHGAETRGDLLAVEPERRVLLVGEFKRLYSTDQAKLLRDDFERVVELAHHPQPTENRHPGLEPFPHERFGLLAGTTHDERYARWFHSYEVRPEDPTGGAFSDLCRSVGTQARWDAATLNDYVDARGTRRQHWLCYVIFPIV